MARTCVWRARQAPSSGARRVRSGAAFILGATPSEKGLPPLPPSRRRSGDRRRTGGSDHLRVFSVAGETRGRSFQARPFSVSLVLCLIARLAPQIKQPFLWVGDLILYVTFLNLARVAFSPAGSGGFFEGGGQFCTWERLN